MRRTRSKSRSVRFTEQSIDLVVDFAAVAVASDEDVQSPRKSSHPRPPADTYLSTVRPGWRTWPGRREVDDDPVDTPRLSAFEGGNT